MSYTVNHYNGAVLTTVADGTIDTTATNIKLIGKNYTGYGEILNENYVWMLENFASGTEPTTPLTGQIWWNTALGTLTVYDGTQFKAVSSSTVDTVEPTGAVEGDLWWDTTNEQLYVYNSTDWILIGPAFAAGSGQSGAVVEVIQDTPGGNDHVVVKTLVSDVVISVTSKDPTFTPAVGINDFGDIYPGITLVNDTGAVPGARFRGKCTDADTLSGLTEVQFLRSDIEDSTSAKISFLTDNGIAIGFTAATGQLTIQTGVSETIRAFNQGLGGNLLLGATTAGGSEVTGIDFDADLTEISVNSNKITDAADPTAAQDVVTKAYSDLKTNEASGGALFADASVSVAGILLPDTNNTRNFGSSGLRYATIYATTFDGLATTAQYADVAERFEADAALEAGTVVMLGGAKEICAANEDLSDEVFGVISTRPAHLMNSAAGTDQTHPPVAMTGRVPVRVTGQVRKGDRLVSAGAGIARAADKTELTAWNVVGRALEDKYSEGEGSVEAIVSMKS